jgi:hypothetical protein
MQEFAQHLGVGELLDEELGVKQRERGYPESEAVLGLSHNLIAGGGSLLDLNVLRGDKGTQQLIGIPKVLAPSTAGEFLCKFDIGLELRGERKSVGDDRNRFDTTIDESSSILIEGLFGSISLYLDKGISTQGKP